MLLTAHTHAENHTIIIVPGNKTQFNLISVKCGVASMGRPPPPLDRLRSEWAWAVVLRNSVGVCLNYKSISSLVFSAGLCCETSSASQNRIFSIIIFHNLSGAGDNDKWTVRLITAARRYLCVFRNVLDDWNRVEKFWNPEWMVVCVCFNYLEVLLLNNMYTCRRINDKNTVKKNRTTSLLHSESYGII